MNFIPFLIALIQLALLQLLQWFERVHVPIADIIILRLL